VLAVHAPGTTRTRSELEELFLEFCDSRGFPRPEVNSSIEGYLCDFVWREQGLIVETDGEQAHGTARARVRDAVRDAELQLAGWMVMRVSYGRLLNDPDGVAAQVGEALRPAPAAPAAPRLP
jgi:very-short-patch-repair endonuclease